MEKVSCVACADRVLQAALEVFSENGYRASIDAVAKRANVARQTIYNNFADKETLFATAISQTTNEIFALWEDSASDWLSRAVQFSLAFRAFVFSPQAIRLKRLLTAEAPRFPELARRYYETTVLGMQEKMAQLIERGMQQGCMRQEDPQEAAQIFLNLLLGADHHQIMFEAGSPDPADEERKVLRAIEIFMRIYAQPETPSEKESSCQP